MADTEQKTLITGKSTFRDIINGNLLYIDKTKYIYELIRPAAGIYFLPVRDASGNL